MDASTLEGPDLPQDAAARVLDRRSVQATDRRSVYGKSHHADRENLPTGHVRTKYLGPKSPTDRSATPPTPTFPHHPSDREMQHNVKQP